MNLANIVGLSVSAFLFVLCFVLRAVLKPENPKKIKRKNTLTLVGMIITGWYFVAALLNILSGRSGISLVIEDFEMFSDRVNVFGVSLARTTVVVYVVVAVIAVLAVLFRIFVVPRLSADEPKGLQNIIEYAIEALEKFVKGVVGDHLGDNLTAYIFALAVYIMGCALSELFGQRAPTSDLTVTFSMALITFFLLNYYGIKMKKLSGRIKSLASPSPVIFPMKVLSDCAVPVSLACRLFGNMVGGLIVMDLLKASLGGYSAGVSAAAGLYFNIAHPLIQTYVFIVLSLTFINEAAE